MTKIWFWFFKIFSVVTTLSLVTSFSFIILSDLFCNHVFVSQWPKQSTEKKTLKSLESFNISEDTIWIVDTSGDEEVFLQPLQLCGLESVARSKQILRIKDFLSSLQTPSRK